jgi:uncharacterized integral membrane protein (TIGR00697 family)
MKMSFMEEKEYLKFFPLFAILIITAQLAASVLGPRTIVVGPLLLPGGIWSFPLTFFLWDIVTEVYGFKKAKQLIFYYFIGQMFFAILVSLGLKMTPSSVVQHPQFYSDVLGNIFKLTNSMVVAIALGDFLNCYILDRMKFYTNGKYLWMRLIGATAIGELATSLTWVLLFYFGTQQHPDMLKLIISQYFIKILFEVIFVPPTYLIVNFLKNNEGFDTQRRYINFDPIALENYVDTFK